VRVGDGLCAPIGQFCEHEGWLHGMPVAAPNSGSARVLPGQPPSLTVTDLSGRARDVVERLVERAQAAFVCIACVPGRFLRRSCRQSVRCAPAVHS